MQFNEPYSDDYMIWDKVTKQYVLTEKALLERVGVNLRARMAESSLISPEVVIASFCTTISDMIYQFIYEHITESKRIIALIATVTEIRAKVQRAMELQAVYVLNVGNLYMSVKAEEREVAIDTIAKSIVKSISSYIIDSLPDSEAEK